MLFVDVAWVVGVIKMCAWNNTLAFLLAEFAVL
jgi:hypothetical protein